MGGREGLDLVSELIVSSGALERKVRLVTAETDVSPVSPDLFHTNVSSLSNTAIVLEEYICGQEVDIDMVICDGRVTFSEVSDNGPTVEPYFGETYNNCPSLLSKIIVDEIWNNIPMTMAVIS